MKGKLIISSFDGEENLFRTDVSSSIYPYDYEIRIRTTLEGVFEDITSKPYDFDESIDFNINVVKEDAEHVEFLKQIKNNRLQYIKNADDIIFYYEPKEIAEFVKRNPILKSKRIIFEDYFDLDPKLVNEVSEAFGTETSNIYFQISGNDDLITFKEYKDTIDSINQKINDIEKYNFSPLEKIMYAYDMVRDKVYVEVDENEDKMISRNLTTALLGDKIVCVGYAKIFKTLVEKLGIECRNVFLMQPDQKEGHARNVIFVKDDSYANRDLEFLARGKEKVINPIQDKSFVISESPTVCNKIFRRDTLKYFYFVEDSLFEDIPFSYTKYMEASKVVTVPSINYFYRRDINRGVSSINYRENSHITDIFKVLDRLDYDMKKSTRYEIFKDEIKLIQLAYYLIRVEEVNNWQVDDDKKSLIKEEMFSIIEEKYGNLDIKMRKNFKIVYII